MDYVVKARDMLDSIPTGSWLCLCAIFLLAGYIAGIARMATVIKPKQTFQPLIRDKQGKFLPRC